MSIGVSPQIFNERWKIWGTTLIYACAVIILSSFHVVWRDEVSVFSMAAESHSFLEFLDQLKYCGHPALWQTLVYIGYHLFPHPIILKIINLLICIGAIHLFLKKAPFSWGQKLLFIAGFFPLYLYPFFNRNYSISMLLMFAVAALYKDRWTKSIPLGIVLFLLASAHVHSFMISFGIGLALLVELVLFKAYRNIPASKRSDVFFCLGLWGLGLLASIWQILPPADSIIFSPHQWGAVIIFKSFIKAILIPAQYFPDIFGFNNKILVNIIVFSMYIYLWRKKNLLIIFAAGVIGIAMFAQLVFPPNGIRHQADIFLLLIMVLWMDASVEPQVKGFKGIVGVWGNYIVVHKQTLLTFLLVIEVCMAIPAIESEIRIPYSSAQMVGQLVKKTPSLKEAMFIGVPDSFLETLPYYLDNPMYVFSEKRLSKYRTLEKNGQVSFNMTDILNTAQFLKNQYGKDIVIILGEEINMDKEEGGSLEFDYQRVLTYSADELKTFKEHTTLLAHLNKAMGDENYRVYLFKS